jgi:hypothetical protein
MTANIRQHQSGALRRISEFRAGVPRSRGLPLAPLALGALLALGLARATLADEPPRQSGGLVAYPVITSLTTPTQNVVLTWSGFSAPYLVEQYSLSGTSHWSAVAGPTNTHSLILPQTSDIGIFRISGQSPNYAGAQVCADCHSDTHSDWMGTLHSHAFEALKNAHSDKNPTCIVCHTVGYGMPSGFIDEATTPQLAGVQCENCHGPAGDHANKPNVLANRPPKVLSANLCGGCHTGAHNPNWDEWSTSAHAQVVPDVASSLLTGGTARMNSCGVCHSGSVRNAKLAQLEDPAADLPTAQEAASTGITCAVCHDPHAESGNGFQLKNPTASLIPFSYSTATNTSFAIQYNDQINACGQCHNARGASWKDTSRPPHHSPQYNMLIGNGGFEVGSASQSDHRNITNQCVHCHMAREVVATPSPLYPNSNGHTFAVKMTACDPCHTADEATSNVSIIQADTQQRIAALKGMLDTWATNKAPAALQTKYGAFAWEYTSPGDLSNLGGTLTNTGPTTAEQATVPDAIKQARYNLYLVQYDNSFGVHNGRYARFLLQVAKTQVQALLAQ